MIAMKNYIVFRDELLADIKYCEDKFKQSIESGDSLEIIRWSSKLEIYYIIRQKLLRPEYDLIVIKDDT